MELVVDANPIISILISPGKPIEWLLIEELKLYAPEFLFVEIENNKEEIIKKSRLNLFEIDELIKILKKRIQRVPEEDFLKYRQKAERICPDYKDIIYFALALHLKCPIWSNEKKLKAQNEIKIFAIHELIGIFK